MTIKLTPTLSPEILSSKPLPLEKIKLTPELDGQFGSNRAPISLNKQIDAENDLEAIYTWLEEHRDSPQTFRNYQKEAERLLLWAIIEYRKSLSSLNRDDLMLYQDFIQDPQPASRWCGPRKERSHEDWRPFKGPLAASSQRQTLAILKSLFDYLVVAGYLAGNPLALINKRKLQPNTKKSVERFLEQELWVSVNKYVESLARETPRQQQQYERLRYLLALFYLLGPRVSEVASHTMSSLVERRGRWWWQVIGKGNKEAFIPINNEMLKAFSRYRLFYGLPALPQPDEQTPLVMSLTGRSSISPNMIYRIIKDVFQETANTIESQEPHNAEKLRRASTHWLRHTAITHQADAGIELRYLNKSARHTKLETTAIYLHAEDEAWHDEMEKHSLDLQSEK